jgi:signal transduction histidine kinase
METSFPVPRFRSSARAWIGFAILGAALIVAFTLSKGSDQAWLSLAIAAVSCAAMAAGVLIHRPARPAAWWLLIAGQLLFFFGDLVWIVDQYALHVGLPSPSFADALYLAGYPFILSALWILLRRRGRNASREGWFDVGVVTAASGVVIWIFVIDRYQDQLLHSLVAAVTVVYPLMDLAIVAVFARLLFTPGSRSTSFNLLIVSMGGLVLSDIAYAIVVANGSYSPGSPIALGWFISYVALGMAMLHPSMRDVDVPAELGERLTLPRLRFLGFLSLVPMGALVVTRLTGLTIDFMEVEIATVLLFVLVFGRMSGLLHEVEEGRRHIATRDADRGRLLDRATRAAEDERLRLAAELHDGPIQHLAGVDYKLERTLFKLEGGDMATSRGLIEEAGQQIAGEIHKLRRLMSELRPPVLTERGLHAALRDHAANVSAGSAVDVEVIAALAERLPPDLETTLYRVGQEALANALRHAGARRVRISLRSDARTAELEVRDDGVGFDPALAARNAGRDHFGLVGMRERLVMAGGHFAVTSSPGAGTELLARAPIMTEAGATV